MKTHRNLYEKIYNLKNLILAWKKARKGKTKKQYVIKFEKNLAYNLKTLHDELKNQTYSHRSLTTFILRDPKTRKISKSDFLDRIVHHAIVRIIEPIFDLTFIYDSCANRKGKGNLFAIQRFNRFKRKASKNNTVNCFILKADIRHYFQNINHEILLNILKRKIQDKRVIWLIERILGFRERERERETRADLQLSRKGMPLGNLTSQFFANVYLNELDQFVKHKLKVKFYIRYVDDFVILHASKKQLEKWRCEIDEFLKEKLKLELHPDKSRITPLSRGIDFIGFRNFYHFKLLRKRNIKNMENKIRQFNKKKLSYEKLLDSFQGWQSYAKWANSNGIVGKILGEINI